MNSIRYRMKLSPIPIKCPSEFHLFNSPRLPRAIRLLGDLMPFLMLTGRSVPPARGRPFSFNSPTIREASSRVAGRNQFDENVSSGPYHGGPYYLSGGPPASWIARNTLSGSAGRERMRPPQALATAFRMAGVAGILGISPMPLAP